jgi:hypothetical protein
LPGIDHPWWLPTTFAALKRTDLDGLPGLVVDDARFRDFLAIHADRGFGRATRLPVSGSFRKR